MARSNRFLQRNSKILASVIAALLVVFGIKKTIDLAAPPKKDKNCDFIYPDSGQTNEVEILLNKQDLPFIVKQKGGLINDASCLNKTAVFAIATITSEDDVKSALQYARENNLKVTSAGERHSMGGHSFSYGGLILDMRGLNQMNLDREQRTLKVQSGAKWSAVQEYLDKEGFSVKAMQSINIFTVGGTLSVNAHGVAHNPGQIAPTVRSLRVMTPQGNVVVASPTSNADLFRHILGGYGLFGIILEAELDVVSNEVYRWSTNYMDYKEFPKFYKDRIENNPEIGLMYARISLSPGSYLEETAVHSFAKTEWKGPVPELTFPKLTWFNRLVINFSKTGSFGRWLRWNLEKYFEYRVHSCVSRNEGMSQNEVCDVSRNQEMYDAMGYLKNKLKDTDILQEYFIPHDKMPDFIDGLREVVKRNDANLLNVTIRLVSKDDVTALPYAEDDRFAFVLYFNQKLNDKESEILKKTTVELIDVATDLGGRFYLPYQLHYTDDQLRKAYPEVDGFFAKKKQYDPNELLINKWYNKYSR